VEQRLLAGTLLLALGLAGCASPPEPRNVLFSSLDTVRQDHLTPYGYSRDTTPRVGELARTSVVFDNAFTQETNTGPSHASMFTGVYPHTHLSRANGQCLAEEQLTLAEILRGAGFRTAGFISGSPMMRLASCLDRGFERYDDKLETHRRVGATTAARALDWLGRLQPDERYFLFLHLYDAHGPYLPLGQYARLYVSDETGPRLEGIPPYQIVKDPEGQPQFDLNPYVDRYDGLLRYLDDLLGLLLERIDLDETIVVLLSDHGETLGERHRKLDHGGQVFDEQIRIPLIVHVPGAQPRRVDQIVETVDLLPTLLELLDVEVPADRAVQGGSLVPLLRGEPGQPRAAFSSARSDEKRHADRGYRLDPLRRVYCVRSKRWKLIRYPGIDQDYVELYDLRDDPEERVNVLQRFPDVAEEYLGLLDGWLGDAGGAIAEPELDPEVEEKLRALGYVGN